MLEALKVIDRIVPLWEVLVVGLALFAILMVLVLWWAYGYNLIIVPEQITTAAKPAALLLPIA